MSRITAILHCVGLGLLTAYCLLLAGCESLFLGADHSHDKIEGMRVNTQQLRLTMRALVNPLTGEVRICANEIIAETEDPEVEFAALRWKATAIPAVREALFAPSGFIALLDTWALSFQMMDYFESGEGKAHFGPYASLGYDCAESINDRMEALYASITVENDTAQARQLLRQWATNYPITDEVDSRETINNQATEISLALGKTFRDSVDEMITTVDDINRKLGVYSAQIPEQARWEAELFVLDVMGYYNLDEMTERMPQFLKTTEQTMGNANAALIKANGLMQDMPEMLEQERSAVLDRLTQERTIVMSEIHVLIEDAYTTLDKVRNETLASIQDERETLQVFITEERDSALNEIDGMRQQLVEDVFRKALILLALIATYVTLLVIAVLWYLNKRQAKQAA